MVSGGLNARAAHWGGNQHLELKRKEMQLNLLGNTSYLLLCFMFDRTL